jgi:hypothetical protein
MEHPESLTSALDGVRSVFLLGGWTDMGEILRRMRHAGVEHVVLLTSRCVIGGHSDNPVTRTWLDSEAAVLDPADIAAVAATALTEPGHAGTSHALSGPESLTPPDQVATLASVLGRPLRYEPLSDEQARREMAESTPQAYIDAFFRFYSDGEFDDSPVVDTVSRITGRPARTFERWARAHAAAFG